jgi:hypothetical protein
MSDLGPAQRHGANEPEPIVMPRPTPWPAATAAGIALVAWGLIASAVFIVVGAALFAISLGGWIGEIRHERREG